MFIVDCWLNLSCVKLTFIITNMEYERQNPANNSEIPERKKPKTNKRTLDKIARVKGEPFFNNKGIAKQARGTGPDCRLVMSLSIYFIALFK